MNKEAPGLLIIGSTGGVIRMQEAMPFSGDRPDQAVSRGNDARANDGAAPGTMPGGDSGIKAADDRRDSAGQPGKRRIISLSSLLPQVSPVRISSQAWASRQVLPGLPSSRERASQQASRRTSQGLPSSRERTSRQASRRASQELPVSSRELLPFPELPVSSPLRRTYPSCRTSPSHWRLMPRYPGAVPRQHGTE